MNRRNVPVSRAFVLKRKDPAHLGRRRRNRSIAVFRQYRGLLVTAVAEQKNPWICVNPPGGVDQRVFVGETGRPAPKQFSDQRRLTRMRASRQQQCTATEQDRPGMHCMKVFQSLNQRGIQNVNDSTEQILRSLRRGDQGLIEKKLGLVVALKEANVDIRLREISGFPSK